MDEELKKFLEELKATNSSIAEFKARQVEEVKAHGAALDETKSKLAETEAKQAELVKGCVALEAKLVQLELEGKRNMFGQAPAVERKSFGQLVTGSEEFKGLRSGSQQFSYTVEKKDITNLAASGGALTAPDRDPEVYRNPNRPVRIRDLIPSIPASTSSVEFMRQNVFTNNAGPQGTVAGKGGGEMVAKAQSEITWELVSLTIPTIAHWVAASRQILNDAPLLMSLIDQDLSYGLDLAGDAQLLTGDGTGQNMTGLMVDAGVPTVGEIAIGTTGDDIPPAMIDHLRAAITECQTNEYYNINGLVLNPIDFATLETAKATDGHYILMPFAATNGQPATIWRVPVVITNAIAQGEFLLGDWTMGAKIRDRESMTVRVGEQHSDYFVKNGVAILAEEQYVLTIPRPKAFCKGSFAVAV